MINDVARLMMDLNVVTSIVAPDIDEVKLMHRLEEVLSNYEIKRKTELDIEDDTSEKVDMFLSAKQIEGLSGLTLEGYMLELRLFCKFVKKGVVQITTSDIRAYLASNKKWQPGTVDRKLSVIKSFFGWLVEEELLLRNPSSKIKSPKKPKRLLKALTVDELEMVRESCETYRERALVEVLYSTGCRLSEIANMKISDINYQDKSATIIGKGDEERRVYLTFKALHHLNNYLNTRKEPLEGDSDYVFIRERRPFNQLTGRSIQRAIDKIENRAKLSKKLTPHTFRHTKASLMMENGAELADVQHILGHKNPSTTLIYAHVSEERKRQAHKRYHAQ
ncbi:tyrosine-type recombinase/integrase [Bacillus niameyensis]|uniref:tyrosine-type recombinase/integrase n=1 Tax=Bacillus niameyensis TaxID=1522308 RepID=UPI0008411FC1|nr:tyrosine-type recombinase/integrase [Bacillus niameyensis]